MAKAQPTPQQLQDMLFAWTVGKYVKSNAIVFCAGGMTLGVGAGQMSRLDSARGLLSSAFDPVVRSIPKLSRSPCYPAKNWPRRRL